MYLHDMLLAELRRSNCCPITALLEFIYPVTKKYMGVAVCVCVYTIMRVRTTESPVVWCGCKSASPHPVEGGTAGGGGGHTINATYANNYASIWRI